jgi:protein subunit release factor A
MEIHMKNKIMIEIKAAEGGDDAKLLVEEHFSSYLKYIRKNEL